MAWRYTAEEECAAILNDDLDEMNSADSLDESFSESSSSTSELDSNPEEDYAGRTINVQVPLPITISLKLIIIYPMRITIHQMLALQTKAVKTLGKMNSLASKTFHSMNRLE